jgi:hypothetical protein
MNVIWQPLPNGQTDFLTCPADIALLDGDRGGGKTETLIIDFLKDVGRGFGASWNGILFRVTYPALEDVIKKCEILIPLIFPTAKYNKTDKIWTFKDGETLKLRYLQRPQDYHQAYHGHQYAWVGLDELTKFNGPWIMMVKSLNRGSNPKIHYRLRATTNPDGVGHTWVKKRFIDPAPKNTIFWADGISYARIFVSFKDNPYLPKNYINSLLQAVQGNKNLMKAWIEGSWDIIAGGIFVDCWKQEKHIIEDLELNNLTVFRTFDWGSSKPFSVGYFIKTNGEELKTITGKKIRFTQNSIIRAKEYYGSNGNEDEGLKLSAREIARNIIDFENMHFKKCNVIGSCADSAIYNDTGMHGKSGSRSIGDEMADEGIYFEKSDKSPGSRVAGIEIMRNLLKETLKDIPENPCFYVCESCRDFIRTIPNLPRDEKKIDDIDTHSEDHIWDETRYFLLSELGFRFKQEKTKGW